MDVKITPISDSLTKDSVWFNAKKLEIKARTKNTRNERNILLVIINIFDLP